MLLDEKALRVSFSAAGAAANPPIVFIHGIRLGRHIWDEHAHLLGHQFRVVTLDLPGHGTLIDARLTVEHGNQQLMYIIENVLKRPPVLVGYSLGGFVAINFAERYTNHTAGLVLVGATLDVTGWKRTIYDLLLSPALLLPRRMCMQTLAWVFRLTLPRKVAETIIATPFNYDVFKQSREMVRDTRLSEKLRGYPNPVLFVTGQFDVIFRPGQQYFAKQCNGQSRVIRGTGHVLPLRRPKQFCDMVRDFVTQVYSK